MDFAYFAKEPITPFTPIVRRLFSSSATGSLIASRRTNFANKLVLPQNSDSGESLSAPEKTRHKGGLRFANTPTRYGATVGHAPCTGHHSFPKRYAMRILLGCRPNRRVNSAFDGIAQGQSTIGHSAAAYWTISRQGVCGSASSAACSSWRNWSAELWGLVTVNGRRKHPFRPR